MPTFERLLSLHRAGLRDICLMQEQVFYLFVCLSIYRFFHLSCLSNYIFIQSLYPIRFYLFYSILF